MRIAVTGSIATDHLMTFEGRFADSLVVDQLSKISLSFLVENLQIRRGGVAANIAFGLGNLGHRPLLVGSVGQDFADYRAWLEDHGVDCSPVLTSTEHHTARFVCTTDLDQAQFATFYAGAMSEARKIDLAPLQAQAPLDLVVVSPNDPAAMLRHTAQARELGIPFAADPSQQLAWSDGETIRELIDGAAYLITNDYEAALIQQKTGWDEAEIRSRVTTVITTHGADGVVITTGEDTIRVEAVAATVEMDPTGVGDGFRAGFLAGLSWGLPMQRCAQVGAMLATLVLETVGPQEYSVTGSAFLSRLEQAYGAQAAAEIAPHLQLESDQVPAR